MNQFIESLKRLFENGNVALFKLEDLKEKNKITENDYLYIINSQTKKAGD